MRRAALGSHARCCTTCTRCCPSLPSCIGSSQQPLHSSQAFGREQHPAGVGCQPPPRCSRWPRPGKCSTGATQQHPPAVGHELFPGAAAGPGLHQPRQAQVHRDGRLHTVLDLWGWASKRGRHQASDSRGAGRPGCGPPRTTCWICGVGQGKGGRAAIDTVEAEAQRSSGMGTPRCAGSVGSAGRREHVVSVGTERCSRGASNKASMLGPLAGKGANHTTH